MVDFNAIILQFADQGEKTGWNYIEVPAHISARIKPGYKKSYCVKGRLDALNVSGIALMPMGNGNFIMALKADIRKGIRKSKGAMLRVMIEEDVDYKVEVPDDLAECFDFEPDALKYFDTLPRSHRDYFLNWIAAAKTNETRAKRIVNTVNAMLRKWDYGHMIREIRKD